MIGGLGYSSHRASTYLQQEQCSDSKFKSPKGIPAHTAPCVGTLWDSAGPQAAPTPPHPHPQVGFYPSHSQTQHPPLRHMGTPSPHPTTPTKRFFSPVSPSAFTFAPPRCGWEEGRALFSSAMLGLPPSVCFLPPTGAKCQSQHLQGITKILRLSPPLSFTQIKHPTHEERRCSPQPSRTTQSKFRHPPRVYFTITAQTLRKDNNSFPASFACVSKERSSPELRQL